MTTKVLIVNHGPGPVLVRTVAYGPEVHLIEGATPAALDCLVPPQTSQEFYVHRNQQLLLGEKRPT